MLRTLTLKNFRKHEDSEFSFTDGLTVIRGSNEAGKSSLGESVMYALFGANMLRESLDAVVTYDKPESSLKVALTFQLDGVDYKIVRGKSGAELTYADQIVTGQRETRLFVERLLGCTADTAKLLMFADQNSIRGVLDKGGTAANGLVETLAQLGLIEELVDRVQSQLPAGNTKAVDAQIQTISAQLGEAPLKPEDLDTEYLEFEIADLQNRYTSLEEVIPDKDTIKAARAKIVASEIAKKAIEKALDRKDEIREILSVKLVKPDSLTDVENTILITDRQILSKRRRAYETIFPVSEHTWEGTLASLEDEIGRLQAEVGALQKSETETISAIAVSSSKRLTDTTCPLCKQALPHAEDAHTINEAITAEISKLEQELAAARQNLKTARSNLSACLLVLQTHRQVLSLASEWHSIGEAIPALPVWVGDIPPDMAKLSEITAKEAKLTEWQKAVNARKLLQRELDDPLPEDIDASFEVSMLEELEGQEERLGKLNKLLTDKESELGRAKAKHAALMKEYAIKLQHYENNAKALQQLTATRDSMHRHNELIRKLRNARPEIASKMWGTVLGAISRYFTQIRGEQSVVTRDADGFKVNGRSVAGLSGSTNDALGLAIRMALSKLFLPGVPLLFLDESFSGCDGNRELAGVGTLAGAGFSQVLLVTHSNLPEQIADNLITL